MAVNPVALCPDLQAWHAAGLSLFYFPDAENVHGLLNPGSRARSQPRVEAEQPKRVYSNGADLQKAPGVRDNTNTVIAECDSSDQIEEARPLDPGALPGLWASLVLKLKPAPVIWTYTELGYDLLVQGDPKRSATLKHIIGGLRLPPGTSSFLPVRVPGLSEEECGREPRIFWRMLQELRGRILIVLGRDALPLISCGANGLDFFQERVCGGKLLLCLPSLEELTADPARMDSTIIYLRSALSKIKLS